MFDRLAYNKRWRRENRERWLKTRNAHRLRNREFINAEQRRRRPKYIYGKNSEELADMLKAQKGNCALCGQPLVEGRRKTVDHDHVTRKVRGIVHQKCNTMIGYFEKHPTIFAQISVYIEKHKES